jgi:glycosyltransferase involved in cell wall biosynthesis
MNFKKRVLILTPFFRPNIGGVESYLDDLCEYLRLHGYMVYVVTYQALNASVKGDRLEKKENLEIYRIPWFGRNWFNALEPYPLLEFLYLTPWLMMYTFFFMFKNRNTIDVIHAQGLTAAFIAKFTGKLFKKRCIISTCAVYGLGEKPGLSKIIRWILSGFDAILPLADFSKRELLSIGVPEEKMEAYYLWVDQEKYVPADKMKSKAAINLQGQFVVLFVGRFIRLKGVDVVLEVAQDCKQKMKFVFIGDEGPFLPIIIDAARRSDNIVLVQGIRGNQLIPYFQAADVLIIPSQYDEAFGKVIIEALSCGTPVIGADKGAIPDIVDASVGIVVVPEKEHIKRAIAHLYEHPDVLSRLTAQCRSYAEKKFSEKNIEKILKHYHNREG